MKKLIDKIEYYHNRLADHNYVWWPFQFLRPKPNELMRPERILTLTIVFATYFEVYYLVKCLIFGTPITLETLLWKYLYFTIFFVFWFTLVLRNFWNRRARRLQNSYL